MEIGGKGEQDEDLGSGREEEQGASSGVLGAQLRSGMAHNSELLAWWSGAGCILSLSRHHLLSTGRACSLLTWPLRP